VIPFNKLLFTLLLVILFFVLFEVIRTVSNPLTPSEDQLRSSALEQTPIGTNMEDVIHHIDSRKKWRVEFIDNNDGFMHQGKKPIKKIGNKYIQVHIGEYRVFTNLYFATDVTVFYGFNENSELIDIWVWKVTDAL